MKGLRGLAIMIVEEVEKHINKCNNQKEEPKKPFDEENWYLIEDKITDILKEYTKLKKSLEV